MKTKSITVLALMLIMGAFFLPTSALAGAPPPEEPQQSSPLPTPVEEEPPAAPVEEPPPSPPWESPPEEPAPGNPFTPDGQATVTDNATSEDGKEFFTFTTPEGNVFFLVIDRNRATDNVYFLNAVTERDLLALAERSDDTPFAPLPEPLPPTEPDEDLLEEPETPPGPEPTPSNNGTIIFAIIAAIAFGVAAYYFKIVRPKKQGAAFDDEDAEFEEEEELEFEEESEYEEDEEEERLFDEIQ